MLLGLLGGNVCCWVCKLAKLFVGSFWWQSELLGLLAGNMYCWVF